MAKRFPGKISRYTFDPHYLLAIGKRKVSFKFGAGPDSAGFDPAVSFIHRFMLRGEKSPTGEV